MYMREAVVSLSEETVRLYDERNAIQVTDGKILLGTLFTDVTNFLNDSGISYPF